MEVKLVLDVNYEDYYNLGNEKFLDIIEKMINNQNDILLDLREVKLK